MGGIFSRSTKLKYLFLDDFITEVISTYTIVNPSINVYQRIFYNKSDDEISERGDKIDMSMQEVIMTVTKLS